MTNNTENTTQILEQWLAEEAVVVERVRLGVGVGIASVASLKDKTGLEIMQSTMEGKTPIAPIAQTLSFVAIHIEPGIALFQGEPKTEYLNPMGTVHGGWMATLLDSAMGTAVLSALPENQAYTTQTLNLKYIKRLLVSPSTARVRVHARVDDMKPRVVTASAEIVGPDGTVYATATTECRVFKTA